MRFQLIFVFLVFVLVDPALAGDDLRVVPPVEGGTAASDNACASAAAAFTSGVADKQLPSWISKCNANPNKDICRETRTWIERETGRKSTEITCNERWTAGTLRPLEAQPASAAERWDIACAAAAAQLVTGVVDNQLPSSTKTCNSNPNKGICLETRKMVEQAKGKNAAAVLTCNE
jgi:hypothetical protein